MFLQFVPRRAGRLWLECIQQSGCKPPRTHRSFGENDNCEDDRSDYDKNEVATDYNAVFQSAVAALITLGY